ncbi:MAG: DUF4097 domain-containing protein [Chloroflexi bacterium]|nr:DUF4097 domain-containing protein [Chloroflexota bacterium]
MSQRGWLALLLVLFLVLILVCWGLFLGSALFFSLLPFQATETLERSIEATSPMTLTLTNDVGTINVIATDTSTIRVKATKYIRGQKRLLSRIQVHVEPKGDTLVLKGDLGDLPPGPHTAGVRWEVYIPWEMTVHIRQDTGTVTVTKGHLRLDIDQGTGSVYVNDVTLRAPSNIYVDTGSIKFRGELPPQGEVTMQVQVGSIRLRLPPTPPFHLEAKVGIGSIRVKEGTQTHTSQSHLTLDVGANPQTTLRLQVDTGNITITTEE